MLQYRVYFTTVGCNINRQPEARLCHCCTYTYSTQSYKYCPTALLHFRNYLERTYVDESLLLLYMSGAQHTI
jgi:uncharacterized Fe-S cluster-containing MiaB family protein